MLIRIMACKEREDNVNKMLSSLWDNVEVIWDQDHNSCHTLCRTLDSDESMLVMEDDLELCKNFLSKAKKEIEGHPNSFVMFYSCKKWEIVEAKHKEEWLPYNQPFVFTQAYYIPKGIWKKLSKFLETNRHAKNHRYSIWMNDFLVKEWIERYLVQPSLVQHIWNESIWDAGKGFKMHQSQTYKYDDDESPIKDLPIKEEHKMKFDYKADKENYVDFLKKKLWIKKKKKTSKKKEEEVEILSLDELNK